MPWRVADQSSSLPDQRKLDFWRETRANLIVERVRFPEPLLAHMQWFVDAGLEPEAENGGRFHAVQLRQAPGSRRVRALVPREQAPASAQSCCRVRKK